MPLPITSLDDRKFDDLVKEARSRLQYHLPEMTRLAEGDPLYALVDLFAWMTESVIYRANLIPQRQRQAFLNLLQLPLRQAQPARGVVCIDAKPAGADVPALLGDETALKAGDQTFSSVGEVQPLPLALAVMLKEKIAAEELRELSIDQASLDTLYGTRVNAFRPRSLQMGVDAIDLQNSLDQKLYLLGYLPDSKQLPHKATLLSKFSGQIINIGIAPLRDQVAERAEELPPRKLLWEIAWQRGARDRRAEYLRLEVVSDTSQGGRVAGVVRLRLPQSEAVLNSIFASDPKDMGFGNTPPEPPVDIVPEQVLFWLRLSAPQENNVELAWLGMNAVDVIGQAVVRDRMIAVGTGRPEQTYSLDAQDIDPDSLQIEVSELGAYVPWSRVDHFAAAGPADKVYRFDAASGIIQFGNGLRGFRPPAQSRIRAAYYRQGGGVRGNLPPGSIKQLVNAGSQYLLRHEWETRGGRDAESFAEAEARIPQHLTHRDRAVTKDDFATLAVNNPVNPIGRAEVVPGLLPGASLNTVRNDVPGVISVFILPEGSPRFGGAPRPTAGLLRDLYQYLDSRKLLGTELYVLSPEFLQVAISLGVEVLDPTTVTETLNAVNQALLNYLWALAPGGPAGAGWPMGRRVDSNEMKAVAARVPGVLSVGSLRLFHRRNEGEAWAESVNLVLRNYQLPEVMEVSAQQLDDDEQAAAPGLVSGGDEDGSTGTAAAAPIIPDLC